MRSTVDDQRSCLNLNSGCFKVDQNCPSDFSLHHNHLHPVSTEAKKGSWPGLEERE